MISSTLRATARGWRARARTRATTTTTRSYATRLPSPPRIRTVFALLTLSAIGLTSVGLYQYTQEYKTWPSFLRRDLRQALLQEERGESDKALAYWTRAWETARARRDDLGEDADLKVSGIALSLGTLLEKMDRNGNAYGVYRQGLEEVLHGGKEVSPEALKRAITLAQKCGDLAIRLKRLDEAERWMAWSVGELVRTRGLAGEEVGNALEALGNLYQMLGHGKERLALPCFLQSLAVLVPGLAQDLPKGDSLVKVGVGVGSASGIVKAPKVQVATLDGDLGRGATLCCNISQLLTVTPTRENIECAEAWTRYGIAMADRQALVAPADESKDPALPVLYFNLGMILEMQDRSEASREAYRKARDVAKSLGYVAGIGEADRALARLG